MRTVAIVILSSLMLVCHGQIQTYIIGPDELCIGKSGMYTAESEAMSNSYYFRDTTTAGQIAAAYPADVITNTFTYDIWVKPTRSITMRGESNICSGVSVPLANSNQNWAIYPSHGNDDGLGVGLSIGTNGLMIAEHASNILVSRLSYTTPITDWVHVAIVYGPDGVGLYLDGVLVRSRAMHCSSRVKRVSGSLGVARYSPDFKGNIDEFRLWDIALTGEQILEVKDKKILSLISGLRYYASFDNGRFERTLGDIGNPTMDVIGLSDLLHIKQSEWSLESYVGFEIESLEPFESPGINYIWSTGDEGLTSSFSPSEINSYLVVETWSGPLIRKDSIQVRSMNCCHEIFYDSISIHDTVYHIIPGGSSGDSPREHLVSYYPLDGNALDFGSGGKDGLLSGAVFTEDRNGISDKACYFDGIDDYIKIPDSLAIADEFTIAFWAMNEKEGQSTVICDGSVRVGGNDFLMHLEGNDIGIRADKSGKRLNHENSIPVDLKNQDLLNKWAHIAWVMQPGYSKVYKNGEEVAHVNWAGSNLGYHDGYSVIGARWVWTNPDHFFRGALDELRIYDIALDASQLKALYRTQTTTTTVYDTSYVTVNDTIRVTRSVPEVHFDSVAVNDTLKIPIALTGLDPPDNLNILRAYPSSGKDYLFIRTGDYKKMKGYTIRIINSQELPVFETPVDKPLFIANLSEWSGMGLYFFQVLDPGGVLLEMRKILLQ